MDDVPAGPASPGPRRPSLSVVIPVHNGGRDFERCLRRLRDSILDRFRADRGRRRLDRRLGRTGRALGRGRGRDTTGRWARPPRGTGAPAAAAPLDLLPRRRRRRPPRDPRPAAWRGSTPTPASTALFGSYDDAPAAPGLVSQFRNLLHHYVHQQGEFVDDARPGPHLLDRLRGDPPRGLPRLRRLRPRALPPPGDRGHRARLPPDPRRAPDRPGPRRPGDPPEAVDARRDDPDRHLPPRRPLDAPDEAERDRRDRPERQARPEALRGVDGPGRCWPCCALPWSPSGCRRRRARVGRGRLAEPRLLSRSSRRRKGPGFAAAVAAAAPALLLLLRRLGRHRPVPVARP